MRPFMTSQETTQLICMGSSLLHAWPNAELTQSSLHSSFCLMSDCNTLILSQMIPSDGQPHLWAWSQQTAWVYNCDHGHVIAALAHQLLCVLTDSDHIAIMVTTSSLIETSDSERLQSYFHSNAACYGSVGSADVLCPNQQWSSCDHGYNKQPDWNYWQWTVAIIFSSKFLMLWQHLLSRCSVS